MASTNGDRSYPLYSSENGKKAACAPKRKKYKMAETTYEIEKRVVKGPGGWADDSKEDSGIVKMVRTPMKFSSRFTEKNREHGRATYHRAGFKHGYGQHKRAA